MNTSNQSFKKGALFLLNIKIHTTWRLQFIWMVLKPIPGKNYFSMVMKGAASHGAKKTAARLMKPVIKPGH